MGFLKQTGVLLFFVHAQGFDLCSEKDMCVSEKCLLMKLYLRSENDPAKEMHTVTHKKENMKDKWEREKYEMLEYASYYSLQARKG